MDARGIREEFIGREYRNGGGERTGERTRERTRSNREKRSKEEITARDLISRRYLHGSPVFPGKESTGRKNEEKARGGGENRATQVVDFVAGGDILISIRYMER